MNRADYWNKSYYDYWNKRTIEAETSGQSKIVQGDTITTKNSTYFFLIEQLDIKPKDVILEVGCGFGRSFDFLSSKTDYIYGIDISREMIKSCSLNYATKVLGLIVSEAERIPFKDNFFDKIICFAVFDALFQKLALINFNEKLKKGGKILITGKNDNYHPDDKLALTAEINARKKNHPNFFTKVSLLLNHLDDFGFKLLKIFKYKFRGDFSKNNIGNIDEDISVFYEYALFLEKISDVNYDVIEKIEISSKFSKTFLALKND